MAGDKRERKTNKSVKFILRKENRGRVSLFILTVIGYIL